MEIGSVLLSLPRMGSIFWVLVERSPTRFREGLPLERGREKLRYARPAFCEFPLEWV